jgi:energy-coupling factor transport system permease protein
MSAYLSRRNPLAVLAVTFGLLAPVLFSIDLYTPLVFMGLAMLHLIPLGRVRIRRIAALLLPLSSVPLGLFLLNVLFHRDGFEAGWRLGLALGLRSEALILVSLSLVLLVRPIDLVNALMQQLGLPARLGFPLYAGWNSLPLLRRDLALIERAQDIRLAAGRAGAGRRMRVAISLLAGALRHAERVSLSMTARGLESPVRRSFYRESRWTSADSVYLAGGLVVAGAALIVLLSVRAYIFTFG